MKKIQLLIFMLCFANVAMAQRKKSTFKSKNQTHVIYYTKNGSIIVDDNEYLADSNNGIWNRKKTCRIFDEQERPLTENFKHFEKKGKKEILILNTDTEITHGLNFKTNIITSKDFVNSKTTKTKTELIENINEYTYKSFNFDATKNSYTPVFHHIGYHENTHCVQTYDYSTYDENGNISLSYVTYYNRPEKYKCHIITSEYYTLKSYIDNKIDTFKTVKYKYNDTFNIKTKKHWYKYPPKKGEIRTDSTFEMADYVKKLNSSEIWRSDKTYEKKEIIYTGIDYKREEKFTFKDSLGTRQYSIFYDGNDKEKIFTTTLIHYKNGVLDSTTMEIKGVTQYTNNNFGLTEKKETFAPEDLKGITTYGYTCQHLYAKETFISNKNDTTMLTFEFYNDPCVQDTIAENNISLYPNPVTSDELTLKINENQKLIKYEIFNSAGQLFFSENEKTIKQTIEILLNINSLEKGYYFLRAFFDNGESKTKSFVKL